jgi:hypothetical protein
MVLLLFAVVPLLIMGDADAAPMLPLGRALCTVLLKAVRVDDSPGWYEVLPEDPPAFIISISGDLYTSVPLRTWQKDSGRQQSVNDPSVASKDESTCVARVRPHSYYGGCQH